jgi:glycosyltransferase involved in cell wall biosynthesis
MPVAGYSGLEHLAWQIAAGLAAQGHWVSLIGPDGTSCPNVDCIAFGPERSCDEKTAYSRYWHRLPDYDVIIDHTWGKWSYMLKAEGKLKAPVLGVCHAPVNTMYQQWPPVFPIPNSQPVTKGCAVCISQDQANHFQALFSAPARVAYNGIDLDFYKPMSVKRNDPYLFLARFSTIKGPDIAIAACMAVGAKLNLVGDTQITQEPEYFARCKSMCDGVNIKLVGPATRGECVYWFSRSLALLHPNQRFREPFGLAPIEAQACGCPVIAWDLGAMRETVKHGETGMLVSSPEEFAAQVKLGLTGVPDTVRKKCREWASQFSIQRMGARYAELCTEAVNTGGW